MMRYRQGLLAGVASLALLAAGGLASAQAPGGTTGNEQHGAQSTPGKSPGTTQGKSPGMQAQSPGGTGQGTQQHANGPATQSQAQEKPSPSGQNQSGAEHNAQTSEHGGASSSENRMAPNGHQAQTTNGHERRGVAHNERGMRHGRQGTAQREQPSHNASHQTQGNQAQGNEAPGNKAPQGTAQTDRASGNVQFTAEQRTQIRQTVIEANNAPRVDHVTFNVTVGTVIPRAEFTTVHVVAVPDVLVTIQPEWRGLEYFIYEDEVVIVDPNDLRIVAVVSV
jgi:hypothetical protein